MSEEQPINKAADTPEPTDKDLLPKGDNPAPQSESPAKSKSYFELMIGFEEIRKIQTNQEVFKKRSTTDSGFEKTKKTIDDKETPKG